MNPFIAGPMLQHPGKFIGREQELRAIVGREQELRAIISRMRGPQPTSVNIVGEHQIGKSSLLYYFFLTWEQRVSQPDNYVVIYISLQKAHCQTEKDFYQELAQELLSCSNVQTQPDLVALLQNPLDRLSFSRAIEEFKKLGLLPVLCLDDFESLFENRDEHRKEFDNGFYDNLRSLMNNSALMLVIASCKKLDFYAEKHRFVSSFFNVGQVITLGKLTTDEAIQLTRLPTNSQPETPALTPNEQDLAQQWGKGYPYLLQLAGFYLYEARQLGRDFKWAENQFLKNSRSKKLFKFQQLPADWFKVYVSSLSFLSHTHGLLASIFTNNYQVSSETVILDSELRFLAGPKIKVPKLFVGRKKKLLQINARVNDGTSVNIYGQRRIGKSSLLYHFYQKFKDFPKKDNKKKYVIIHLDLSRCQSQGFLYYSIAQEIIQKPFIKGDSHLYIILQDFISKYIKTKQLIDSKYIISYDSNKNLQNQINKAFNDAIINLNQHNIIPVICLDEWDTLFQEENSKEFDNVFFRKLRSLINDSSLILVIVSEKVLHYYFSQRNSVRNFSHPFHFIQLNQLTNNEAEELVKLPADQPVLGDKYQKIARKWGRRHPLLLQLAASCIYDAYENSQQSENNKTARQIIREARTEFDRQLKHFFPYKIINWQQGLFFVIRWLFRDLPIKLGRIPKAIGVTLNDFNSLILGLAILGVIFLAFFSRIMSPEVLQWLQKLIEKVIN
ncbi:AAA-like domain-containing protein [Rivularia sp. PCC 7116]|uniref:nSTAND1 domain-containing NTPase n=1 Tax=Rivularia sp. PCC 7116 TaxID=373994 RepID=UPI001E3FD584|nr:TniB family NTP-binding protein [Rivularia sp. PCC 7116]